MQKICTGTREFTCHPCGRENGFEVTYSHPAGSVNHDPQGPSGENIRLESSHASSQAVGMPALLFSEDLSHKLQKALRARQELSKYQQFFDKEHPRLRQAKECVDWDLNSKARLIDLLQAEMEEHGIECSQSRKSRLDVLKSESELLAQKSQAYAQEMKGLDRRLAELQWHHAVLREDADEILDDVFTKCGLLNDEPSDLNEEPSPTLDSSEMELEETQSHTYTSDGGSSPSRISHTPQQGLREWVNDSPDDEAFMDTPARMITVNDGERDRPSLLPSVELLENIKEVLLSNRELTCFSKVLDDEEDQLEKLKSAAKREISYRNRDIENLEQIREQEAGLTQAQERSLEECRSKIQHANEVVQSAEGRLEQITERYNEMAHRINEVDAKITSTLEDVYIKCGLIPAEDKDALIEEFRSQLPPSENVVFEVPEFQRWEEPDEYEWYEGTRYDDNQCSLARKVHNTKRKKYMAEYALERHFGSYYNQFQDYVREQVNRPHVDFAEEFGPMFLRKAMDLSMDISNVEKELEAAKTVALDAGVQPEDLADGPEGHDETLTAGGKVNVSVSNVNERCKQILSWIEETPELEGRESSFPDLDVAWPLPDKSRFELEKPKPVESGNLEKDEGVSADNGELGEDSEEHDSIFGTLTDIDGDEYREKIDEWSRKVRGGKH